MIIENIHPLWIICIIVRIGLIFLTRYLFKNNNILSKLILLIIAIGFIYQSLYGSNNEIQVAKVFWHEARFFHGILYLVSLTYLIKNNLNMSSFILLIYTEIWHYCCTITIL